MTVLKALATLRAAEQGRAVPITTVRHVHLVERPLVFVPLQLAGEACAPLAAMVGTDRSDPRLLIVCQPKDRAERFRFAAELGQLLRDYLDRCRAVGTETVAKGRTMVERYREAPQLLVPNRGGVRFAGLLGRSTRLRPTAGPYAVDPAVPELGTWLTWFADSAEIPDRGALLSMTTLLSSHWASGQSATEDRHLGALLAWIDPPDGLHGADAALRAEDPIRCPPAGPATDPQFDRRLAELIMEYRVTAAGSAARSRARRRLERVLRTQLEPVWRDMWQGVDLLRGLPEGARAARRWEHDLDVFTARERRLAEGNRPQARRDNAAGAARRLARLEEATARFEMERAFDDPLVMAEYELVGEAFTGTVIAVAGTRTVRGAAPGARTKLRPLITLRTDERPGTKAGAVLTSPAREAQHAVIVAMREQPDGSCEVDMELSGGMGRGLTPSPGSLPSLGEELCYASFGGFVPSADLPDDAHVPWTHGGPTVPYQRTDADAREVWG